MRADVWIRLAGVTLAFSAAVLVGAGLGAIRLEPIPDPAPTRFELDSIPVPTPRPTFDLNILQAVARNPFRPDRVRAQGRYNDLVRSRSEEPGVPQAVQLVGLASGGRRNLALIVSENEPPRLRAVGDSIGGYRVARIGAGTVVLQGSGADLTLQLSTPLQRTASP
jgi:hypothetical protein